MAGGGIVTVTGSGSQWNNSTALYIGNAGSGALSVAAGVLRMSIDKAVDQITRQAESLVCAPDQQSGASWRDVQLMPDIDSICEMAITASGLRDNAHNSTDKKDIAKIWGVTHFFANISASLSGQQSPFAQTHAALAGAERHSAPLDSSSLNVLLSELISAGRVNAKAAERVGQQRAQDDQAADAKAGMAGANRLREHGTDYEMRLGLVERLSKLNPDNGTALVQACLMSCQILADSGADYVVYESIGAVSLPGKSENAKADDTDDAKAPDEGGVMAMENPELAARIVHVARKNAELEISSLLDRDENAVLPIYEFELGDSQSDLGVINPENLRQTLARYYRATLTASLMERLMDMEEGVNP